jgi:hypothetical protein
VPQRGGAPGIQFEEHLETSPCDRGISDRWPRVLHRSIATSTPVGKT